MTPRLQHVAPHEPARRQTATVDGLDHGRTHARGLHRRKRRRERVRSGFIAVLLIALVGGGAYAAYLFYGDFESDEELERQEIRAGFDPGTGDDLRDAIDELETTPKFNGPGVPGLGVGDEP